MRMLFQMDELLVLLSTLAVVYGIARAISRHGGFRRCVRTFIETGAAGDVMLLFLLIIPEVMLAVYYISLVLVPAFQSDVELRAIVVRPSIFTSNVILAVYFLNGSLVRGIRNAARWGVEQWNKFGTFRI